MPIHSVADVSVTVQIAETTAPKKELLNSIKELDGVKEPDRGAKFVSAIACVFPDGRQFTVRGETFGRIAFEKEGDGGFGYDPVFLYEGKSFGKMTGEQKDAVSHRGKALDKCLAELKKYLGS